MPLDHPRTYSTPRGGVIVLAYRQSHYLGMRCMEVELTGAIDAYFSDEANILARETLPDGSTRFWYIPDDEFPAYAEELDRLGAWGNTP